MDLKLVFWGTRGNGHKEPKTKQPKTKCDTLFTVPGPNVDLSLNASVILRIAPSKSTCDNTERKNESQ